MIQFDDHIFRMGWNHQLIDDFGGTEPLDFLMLMLFLNLTDQGK